MAHVQIAEQSLADMIGTAWKAGLQGENIKLEVTDTVLRGKTEYVTVELFTETGSAPRAGSGCGDETASSCACGVDTTSHAPISGDADPCCCGSDTCKPGGCECEDIGCDTSVCE